jgi:hypothetical protein
MGGAFLMNFVRFVVIALEVLILARVLLSWPLVAVCLAASWWVLRRSLPPDHPGLRHPSG